MWAISDLEFSDERFSRHLVRWQFCLFCDCLTCFMVWDGRCQDDPEFQMAKQNAKKHCTCLPSLQYTDKCILENI